MVNAQAIEILLVEDNDNDAELTLRALQQAHLSNRIHRLANGQEALDYLFPQGGAAGFDEVSKPKLILIDLKLPLVSGLEVLKTIKNDPRTQMIPLVVLTSSTQEKDILESYRLKVNSYIVKPFNFDRFVELIQRVGIYWLTLNETPPA